MKMKRIAIGFALLALTTSAMAFDGDRRASTSGAIVWSTRDSSGNQLGIVFQFGDRLGVDVNYRQAGNGRYERNDRYDDRGFRGTPPLYDYKRYRGRDYDRRFFSSYEEWSDWRTWQSKWSKKKNWNSNERERSRAWQAFLYERKRAMDRYAQNHNDRWERDNRNKNKGRGNGKR